MPRWAASSRPSLDEIRLDALNQTLENRLNASSEQPDWSDLFPRLDSTPLTRLEGDTAKTIRTQLGHWLTLSLTSREEGSGKEGGSFPRHGALLLAELGHITPQTVLLLCACLVDAQDLTRYRARTALSQQRPASTLGQETIEQMARCYRCETASLARADCSPSQGGSDCWRSAPPYLRQRPGSSVPTWIGPSRRSSMTAPVGYVPGSPRKRPPSWDAFTAWATLPGPPFWNS